MQAKTNKTLTRTFLTNYDFFKTKLNVLQFKASASFKLEARFSDYLIKTANKKGWTCFKIETRNKDGFPDLLFVRHNDYLLIEAKLLKKKHLVTIQGDLRWEYGQLAFMKEAFDKNLNYAIAVAKGNNIAIIYKGDSEHAKLINNTYNS